MTEHSKNKVQNLAYTVTGGVIVGIILLVAQYFTLNTITKFRVDFSTVDALYHVDAYYFIFFQLSNKL